jgi:hypothetical protein
MADGDTPIVEEKPWWSALDAEHQGHVQNKGWEKLGPAEAAIELTKAWKGAEKLIGIPKDELLRMPKADDAEAQKAFWGKLGAKEKAEEYQFTGQDKLDPKLVETARAAAFELRIPADKADAFMQKFVAYEGSRAEANAAAATVAKNLELEKLRASWGPNYDVNLLAAQRAASTIPGITPEAVTALESTAGYSVVMEMFRNLDARMGEAKFHTGDSTTIAPAMTYEQAVAEKADLMRDKVFVNKWINDGDRSPQRVKIAELDRLIASNPNHLRR